MFDLVNYKNEPNDNLVRFAFSLHKCGSSLFNGMVSDVCEIENIANVNIPGPMFRNGILERDWQLSESLLECVKPGYIHHSFRGMPPTFKGSIDFSSALSVLLIRDPRDAMVSQYFSFKPGGSHITSDKNKEIMEERKKRNSDLDIDEYAKKFIIQHRNKLKLYYDTLNMSFTKVYKYEDVYFDKLSFLSEVFSFWKIDIPKSTLDKVVIKRDIRPEFEDPSKHIRKGTPGDHREKLKPETIEYINEVMRPVSSLFGYYL